MNDEDVLIDKVLAGLRDAEPSPGLEHRIRARMEAHQPRTIPWRWPVLALACVVLAVFVIHSGYQAPPPLAIAIQPPGPQLGPMPLPETEPEPLPATYSVERTKHRSPQPRHPAMPWPLTDQEKLLLRLAHRPADATILNPATREQQSAKATTEFQHFFQMDEAEMRSHLE